MLAWLWLPSVTLHQQVPPPAPWLPDVAAGPRGRVGDRKIWDAGASTHGQFGFPDLPVASYMVGFASLHRGAVASDGSAGDQDLIGRMVVPASKTMLH